MQVSRNLWKYIKEKNSGRNKTDVFLSNTFAAQLYSRIKDYPYIQVEKLYLDKDTMLDDEKHKDDGMHRESKRDKLIQQLFSIQLIVQLYKVQRYNE